MRIVKIKTEMQNMTAKEIELALVINKLVHDNCTNVPHDIGLRIIKIFLEKYNQSRWISVKESGLPKVATTYWVWTDRGLGFSRMFNSVSFDLAEYDGNVTHYQPLPAIPTE